MERIRGRVWKFGDNINTDNMSPAQYMFSIEEVAKHCLEAVRPEFCIEAKPGDIVLGGDNFGTGSSRETAPRALKELGIGLVLAKSFARIFYRNCVDIGLPAMIIGDLYEEIEDGDILVADVESNEMVDETKQKSFEVPPIPTATRRILEAGGLIPYAVSQHW